MREIPTVIVPIAGGMCPLDSDECALSAPCLFFYFPALLYRYYRHAPSSVDMALLEHVARGHRKIC